MSDTMQFFRASVYASVSEATGDSTIDEHGGDDRYQVRILPAMAELEGDNLQYLPIFPLLFKNAKPCFKTEKADGKEASIVLIMCTPDYSQGYIIGGPLSNWTGGEGKDVQNDSYPFDDFKTIINEQEKGEVNPARNFVYSELTIDSWCAGEEATGSSDASGASIKAGFICAHNEKTGDMYWINGSGSVMAFGSGYFCISIGGKNQAGKNSSYAQLLMSPGRLFIQADAIELNSDNIKLGSSGLMFVGSSSVIPSDAHGMPLATMSGVHG